MRIVALCPYSRTGVVRRLFSAPGPGPGLGMLLVGLLCCVFGLLAPGPGAAAQTPPADAWAPLVARLTADGFDPSVVRPIFSRPEVRFDASVMAQKMTELYTTKYGSSLATAIAGRLYELGYLDVRPKGKASGRLTAAIKAYQQLHALPVDGKPGPELLSLLRQDTAKAPPGFTLPPPAARTGPAVYRSILTPERLAEAEVFHGSWLPVLQHIQQVYGIAPEIAVGLLAVETRLGKFLGEKSALITLASMAMVQRIAEVLPFFQNEQLTPAQRTWMAGRIKDKSDWAYAELKALLVYAAVNRQDPVGIPGSVYGAIGIAQFMPTNALKFGVDGNNDGNVDLFRCFNMFELLKFFKTTFSQQRDLSGIDFVAGDR